MHDDEEEFFSNVSNASFCALDNNKKFLYIIMYESCFYTLQ